MFAQLLWKCWSLPISRTTMGFECSLLGGSRDMTSQMSFKSKSRTCYKYLPFFQLQKFQIKLLWDIGTIWFETVQIEHRKLLHKRQTQWLLEEKFSLQLYVPDLQLFKSLYIASCNSQKCLVIASLLQKNLQGQACRCSKHQRVTRTLLWLCPHLR